MEAAAGIMQPDGTAYLNGQTVVQHLFSQAVTNNIGVIRAFGHGATGNFILQPSPGTSAASRFCPARFWPGPGLHLPSRLLRILAEGRIFPVKRRSVQ